MFLSLGGIFVYGLSHFIAFSDHFRAWVPFQGPLLVPGLSFSGTVACIRPLVFRNISCARSLFLAVSSFCPKGLAFRNQFSSKYLNLHRTVFIADIIGYRRFSVYLIGFEVLFSSSLLFERLLCG